MNCTAALTLMATVVVAACHDGVAPTTVETGSPNAGYGHSNTGGTIAFTSQLEGNADVWIMASDGTSLTNLTRHPAGDLAPDWSGNGEQIVFLTNRDGGQGTIDIYVMNADGSGVTRLTPTSDIVRGQGSRRTESRLCSSESFSRMRSKISSS
jgi:Tol biopolymer transport system component